MRLLTLHFFFLALITVFHMFSAVHLYLFLLFSHFVVLFSPSFSFSSRQETHSTIYNVSFNFITVCQYYYGDKKYFIVHYERKRFALYNQPNVLIFSWKKVWWVFTCSLSNYFLFIYFLIRLTFWHITFWWTFLYEFLQTTSQNKRT